MWIAIVTRLTENNKKIDWIQVSTVRNQFVRIFVMLIFRNTISDELKRLKLKKFCVFLTTRHSYIDETKRASDLTSQFRFLSLYLIIWLIRSVWMNSSMIWLLAISLINAFFNENDKSRIKNKLSRLFSLLFSTFLKFVFAQICRKNLDDIFEVCFLVQNSCSLKLLLSHCYAVNLWFWRISREKSL